MKKWEYLFMDTMYDSKCKTHRPIQVNRDKLELESDVCIDDYSNRLGNEGWELVNALEIGDRMRLIFKRQRSLEMQ